MTWALRWTGWAWPTEARVLHYFIDGKVQCGSKWRVYDGETIAPEYLSTYDHCPRCATCSHKALVPCPACDGQGEILVSGDPRGDNAETRTCDGCRGESTVSHDRAAELRESPEWDGP